MELATGSVPLLGVMDTWLRPIFDAKQPAPRASAASPSPDEKATTKKPKAPATKQARAEAAKRAQAEAARRGPLLRERLAHFAAAVDEVLPPQSELDLAGVRLELRHQGERMRIGELRDRERLGNRGQCDRERRSRNRR